MTENKILRQAIVDLEEFLVDNPHMRAYQEEIETLMDKVPEHQRLEVIQQLMLEKMLNLRDSLGEIKGTLNNVTVTLGGLKGTPNSATTKRTY